MHEIKREKIKYRAEYNALDIATLEVGSVVVFDIYIRKSDDYVVIIKAGTKLEQKLRDMLQKQEAVYVSKMDEKNQTLNCNSLRLHLRHNKDNFAQNLDSLYKVNSKLFSEYLESQESKFDLNCVNKIIESIIALVKSNKEYLKETLPLLSSEHTLANHSLHVSIYAINIGNLLHLNDIELKQLGTAGLLHDIGLKKIDESITNKEEKLTLEELESVQAHSKYSVDIAIRNHVNNPYIVDAIMHHHESLDGSGYPDHLRGNDISDFASILSISDVFDALTNDRPYREKMSTFSALTLMMKDPVMANNFNAKYIKVFLKSLI